MRARLFLILVVTTGVVWLSAVVWIYGSTKSEVERVLDARLMEAANMVSSLMTERGVGLADRAETSMSKVMQPASYERQLACQIWSFEGNLLSKTEGTPSDELTAQRTGFSDTVVNGETWRVYAVENKDSGIRVLVGDTRRIRANLVGDLIKGLLLPLLLIMPILAGLIWLSVKGGLAPLNRLATALGTRSAADLSALTDDKSTSEMTPVFNALNGLFKRVADARERERNFTTFAAHELRTPLAGLKTQAQVALASNDPQIRERALEQIAVGVNRTGRLVRQLLDLASVDAEERETSQGKVNPGDALAMLRGEFLAHSGQNTQVLITEALRGVALGINPDLFSIAARNLLENALLHSPPGGIVRCDLDIDAEWVTVVIDDCGPGIPETELAHVTEPFFRGRNKSAVGSGLGLSIAQLALAHAGARLVLRNRGEGGLSARIVLPRETMALAVDPGATRHTRSPA
ncbi:ATP-binding protein [Chelatococcus sp. GCM10030263]|uniref:ATP-binding protein n=1 Tax=Chelatococcus sp. GCM10030263 TaxID=3273387 RepID=UPI003622CEB0